MKAWVNVYLGFTTEDEVNDPATYFRHAVEAAIDSLPREWFEETEESLHIERFSIGRPIYEGGPGPTSDKEIGLYLHCALCVQELVAQGIGASSPRDYAQLEVGWSNVGLQVWCRRHNCNVVHLDFQGQQHPANTERML